MWYIYTVEYYLAVRKEWNNAICSYMDGPRDYHTKQSKSERETQIPYYITYMWNVKKKKIQMNLFIKQKQTHRQKTNLWLPKGKGRGGKDKWGSWD